MKLGKNYQKLLEKHVFMLTQTKLGQFCWKAQERLLDETGKKSSEIVRKACLHADSENQVDSVEFERK